LDGDHARKGALRHPVADLSGAAGLVEVVHLAVAMIEAP
jgi:hypothetical protein